MGVEPLLARVTSDHVKGLWLSADAEELERGGRVDRYEGRGSRRHHTWLHDYLGSGLR